MFLELARPSEWRFDTSNSGSLAVGLVAGEGGSLTLREPTSHAPVKFYYLAGGGGYSFGFRLPKIGKIELRVANKSTGGTVSSENLPSGGLVYVVQNFHGTELTRRDIGGACAFAEVVGGIVAGGSANAMLFGMNPAWLAAGVASSPVGLGSRFFDQAALSATGIVIWAGANVGIQGGFGGAAYVGLMFEGSVQSGRGWRK